MNDQHKLWARFRLEEDGEITVTLTPVLFWTQTDDDEYIAYVPSIKGQYDAGYAYPINHKKIVEYYGKLESFVLFENLTNEIEKLRAWVTKNEDDRGLTVYPSY